MFMGDYEVVECMFVLVFVGDGEELVNEFDSFVEVLLMFVEC